MPSTVAVVRLAVGGAHGDLVGAVHHVRGGEDEARRVVDEAGAEALAGLDLHDRGREGLGDRLDRLVGGARRPAGCRWCGRPAPGCAATRVGRLVVGRDPTGAEAGADHQDRDDDGGHDPPPPGPTLRRECAERPGGRGRGSSAEAGGGNQEPGRAGGRCPGSTGPPDVVHLILLPWPGGGVRPARAERTDAAAKAVRRRIERRAKAEPFGAAGCRAGATARRSTRRPALPASRIVPPWLSAIWRTMVRPRPLRPSCAGPAPVAPPEPLEHPLALVLGDARALVLDRDPDPLVAASPSCPPAGRQPDGRALRAPGARRWPAGWPAPGAGRRGRRRPRRPGSAARLPASMPRASAGTANSAAASATTRGERRAARTARTGRALRGRRSGGRRPGATCARRCAAPPRRCGAGPRSMASRVGQRDVEVGADHRQRVAQLVRRLLDEAALALERLVDAGQHPVEGVGQVLQLVGRARGGRCGATGRWPGCPGRRR